MKDFLTDQEIEELTGAKQESKQKEILTKNRIFFVDIQILILSGFLWTSLYAY